MKSNGNIVFIGCILYYIILYIKVQNACKDTKKIAYAQGLCDFFGVECKDGQQSCSLEDARYTRYSLEFKGKDTQMLFGKMNKHFQRKVVVAGY